MAIPLAQNMPGMEWLPLMLLFTAGGLLFAVMALVLRPFGRARIAGRRLSIGAIIIGVTSTSFFAAVVGNEFMPIAYLFLASPALVGIIAFEIYPRKVNEARVFPVISPEDPKSKS